MGFPLAVDGCVNIHHVAVFAPLHLVHRYAYAVRNFFPEQQQRLFANQLRADDTLRLVGDHILRKVLRTDAHTSEQFRFELLQTFARVRGTMQNGLDKASLFERGNRFVDLAFTADVAFVDERNHRRFGAGKPI